MRVPSPASTFPAARPSVVSGTFTMTFGSHAARRRPSTIMSSRFSLTTSAETFPMILQMRFTWSSWSWPAFAMSVGLVVTPSMTPQRTASSISS